MLTNCKIRETQKLFVMLYFKLCYNWYLRYSLKAYVLLRISLILEQSLQNI